MTTGDDPEPQQSNYSGFFESTVFCVWHLFIDICIIHNIYTAIGGIARFKEKALNLN